MTAESATPAVLATPVQATQLVLPFYRKPWFLTGLVVAALFFWPLAIVPAILIWTGPIYRYTFRRQNVEAGPVFKAAFTVGCIAYMGWYGAKLAKAFAPPGCSAQQTLALVERIINEKFLDSMNGRASMFPGLIGLLERKNFEPFQVSSIRTVGDIAANGGSQCEAQVTFPYTDLSGGRHTVELSMDYTVEPVDNSHDIFVQVQFPNLSKPLRW